ncbi:MAG: MerC domain-containing protein [Bryobacterales bacterium]|nr:MerC domain-containing protein [Bryobacterales bacterium]
MSTITANPIAKSEPRSLDRIGMMLSGACAVHCILMPFVVGGLVYMGADWVASETTELLLVGSAFLVAIASLIPSYLRHRNPAALILFASGIALIVGAHTMLEHQGVLLGVGMALGGCLIAFAHYRNHRLCACCVRR